MAFLWRYCCCSSNLDRVVVHYYCVQATATEQDVKSGRAWATQVHNESGTKRVIVTKPLPGDRWLQYLVNAGCRVEVSQHPDIILSNATIKQLIGSKCDGVIGQLTEVGQRPPCGAAAARMHACAYHNLYNGRAHAKCTHGCNKIQRA